MVQEIKIAQLNAAPYNPRVELAPGMPEWEKLERSITEIGYVVPIVWNKRTGNVVGGHQRLAVMKHLGYDTIPCSVVDLDETDEKLLNVALNKIKGQWDYEKLEAILKDFDYEVAALSGFSEDEIAVILANNSDLIDDSDFGEWDDEYEGEILGGSYVVTLVFENSFYAERWAEDEGFTGQIKEGSQTTVIRIDE